MNISYLLSKTSLLGSNVRSLLQEHTNRSPEAVAHPELVNQHSGLLNARKGVIPFTRGNAAQNEQTNGDTQICGPHAPPDFVGERRHEGKQRRWLLLWLLIENGDSQIHKGHREIHSTLTFGGNCEVCNRQVGTLRKEMVEYENNSSAPVPPSLT